MDVGLCRAGSLLLPWAPCLQPLSCGPQVAPVWGFAEPLASRSPGAPAAHKSVLTAGLPEGSFPPPPQVTPERGGIA